LIPLYDVSQVYQYTLIEEPTITVADFRTKADAYRKRQVGKEVDNEDSEEHYDELARKFWRRLGPTMEPAVYGADTDGTLFKDAHASGWNVDRLESCLCLLRADASGGDRDDEVFHLPGVTSAYLYFGMWASAFAAHAEDMNLLSINYLHAGAPKYWYAVNPEDSKRFENLATSHFPGQASECSEFLRHKRCLLSPSILKKAGIRFTTCVQRPGDASKLSSFISIMFHLIKMCTNLTLHFNTFQSLHSPAAIILDSTPDLMLLNPQILLSQNGFQSAKLPAAACVSHTL
jgi:jumonji domain-containing protein 2